VRTQFFLFLIIQIYCNFLIAFLSDSHETKPAGFGTVSPSRGVQASKEMAYSDTVISTFAPLKYLAEVGAQYRNSSHRYDSSDVSSPGARARALIVFCAAASFEGLLHVYCSPRVLPNSFSGPKSGSQTIDGRLSCWLGLFHACVMETSHLHKYTTNYQHCSHTFTASVLSFGHETSVRV
jgi:hypothetical protein